jgi:hypothetical protein
MVDRRFINQSLACLASDGKHDRDLGGITGASERDMFVPSTLAPQLRLPGKNLGGAQSK